MIEADEMFEELGYNIIKNKDKIIYILEYKTIDFLLNYQKIEYHYLRGNTFMIQDMQELKAINKKCLELGWIK